MSHFYYNCEFLHLNAALTNQKPGPELPIYDFSKENLTCRWYLMFLYFSPLPPSAPSLLSSILKNSASPLLWRLHPCSEENSPESSGGPFQPMDWTHDPEGTPFTAFVFLRQLLITWNIIGCCCFDMGIFNVHVWLQALHLVGQALLEEKTQLESSRAEEVTFDFSLKAQSKMLPFILA